MMKSLILLFSSFVLSFSELHSQVFVEVGVNHCDLKSNNLASHIYRPEFGLGYELPLKIDQAIFWNNSLNYSQYYSKRAYHGDSYGYTADFLKFSSGLMLRSMREKNPNFVMGLSTIVTYKYRLTLSFDSPGQSDIDNKVKLDPGNQYTTRWNYGVNFEIGTEIEWKSHRVSLRFQIQPLFLPEFKNTRGRDKSEDIIFWRGIKLVYTPRIKKSYDRSISQ